MYRIKELPISERPRERLKSVGVNNLTDKELISIILKTGTKDKNVNELSLDILSKYSLIDLKNITLNDLISIKGIGEVKAIELLTSIELGKRIFLKESKKLTKLEKSFISWFLLIALKNKSPNWPKVDKNKVIIRRPKTFTLPSIKI